MRNMYIKSLLRSPVKTISTLLLIIAASFLFMYSFAEYDLTRREYEETKENYQGVLTLDGRQMSLDNNTEARFNYYLLSDPTKPGRRSDIFPVSRNHYEPLESDIIDIASNLPYISRVDTKYMTAGVSEYTRMDNEQYWFDNRTRCVLVGTYTGKAPGVNAFLEGVVDYSELTIKDVEMLAGDERWLLDKDTQTIVAWAMDETKIETMLSESLCYFHTGNGYRAATSFMEPEFYGDALEHLEVGHRYIFVVRYEERQDTTLSHYFYIGDDTRYDWWPYIYDITDLNEDWLETEEFAPLRELIRITEDDRHTFDVVYTDNMSAIRRVADERIMLIDGRFITPADAGQPVCVVSDDILERNSLAIGDTITLSLGDQLFEQYAPMGAVACTQGRYAKNFTEQQFTIIGSYHDMNDGGHVARNYHWVYSDNSIFVPTAFLPETAESDTYETRPPEISFVVEDAENIELFISECLPVLDANGIIYEFSDGNWPYLAAQLRNAMNMALIKMALLAGAALFAVILAVWLYMSRKKCEYGIFRALGMKSGKAGSTILVPLGIIGIAACAIGSAVAAIISAVLGTVVHIEVFVFGALGFFALMMCFAFVGVLLLRRNSIMELIRSVGK